MRTAFMKTLVDLAQQDERIVLLFGDVKQDMAEFEKRFPGRLFNLGMAEQTMIGIASGMALEGLRPVVYTLTPFAIARPYEQVFLDVDQQKAPVIIAGFDACRPNQGITHSGKNAAKLAATLENTDFYSPTSSAETSEMLVKAYHSGRPAFFSLVRADSVKK